MTRPSFIATSLLYITFIRFSIQLVAVGVDYGNEYVKVSMVYPGSPLDMVLTPSGQRKFINSITLNGEYRLFGTESRQKLQKNPLYTLDSRIPPTDKLSPSFTVKVDDKTRLHWSEVASNLLSHIDEQINKPNKSLVMAIPSYYGLSARYVLEEAIYLSGFKHLAFVDQGVAAGHALAQSIQKPTTVLIYDLGEDGAKVSVLSIVPKNVADKTLTTVNMLGVAFEPDVGGGFHDKIIRKLLTEKAKDPKLFEYVPLGDYKKRFGISDNVVIAGAGNREFVTLTSEEFNKNIEPSLHLLNNPIVSALEMADKSLSDIESVEIIGGSWRLPVVRKYLEEIIKPHTLSIHLNADEAIAIGSGLVSASLSSKPFLSWTELSLYPLLLKCFYLNSNNEPFETVEVFSKGSLLTATQQVIIQASSDFSISFYDHNGNSNIADEGFPRFIVKLGSTSPSEETDKPEVHPEEQQSPSTDKEEDTLKSDQTKEDDNNDKPFEGETMKSEDPQNTEQEGAGAPTTQGSRRVRITVVRDNKGIQVKTELLIKDTAVVLKSTQLDYTTSNTLSARKQTLENYIKKDKEYNSRAIAYSNLESALYENYSLLDKINSLKMPETIKDFSKMKLEHFISDTDKTNIKEETSRIESWLEKDGNKANLTDFENRLNRLKSSVAPSKSRQIAFSKWINVYALLERETNNETLQLYHEIISNNPDDYGKSHETFKDWLNSHFNDIISLGVNNLSTSQLMDGTLKLKKFTEATLREGLSRNPNSSKEEEGKKDIGEVHPEEQPSPKDEEEETLKSDQTKEDDNNDKPFEGETANEL